MKRNSGWKVVEEGGGIGTSSKTRNYFMFLVANTSHRLAKVIRYSEIH